MSAFIGISYALSQVAKLLLRAIASAFGVGVIIGYCAWRKHA